LERIRRLAAFVLGLAMLAGTGIAVYLVWHHENEVYGDTAVDLGNCPQTETVNCEAVNSSEYSEVLGVPVAALAIPTYLVVLGLVAIGRRKPRGWGHAFGLGLAAVAFSGWLYYVSVTKIGFLCLWCLRLYAINASIPVLRRLRPGAAHSRCWRNPGPT